MATRNPVLSRFDRPGFAYQEGKTAFAQAGTDARVIRTIGGEPAVTINDVVVKSTLLFGVLLAAGVVGWSVGATAPALILVAMLVGLGLAIANIRMARVNPALVIGYALAEGFLLGGVSHWYSALARPDSNIVYQAVLGTAVTFGVMLLLYTTHVIRVTATFMRIMAAGLIAYLVIALASLVGALFGVGGGWGFYGVHGLGLLLCVVGVGLAAFSLAMDFEAISRGVEAGLPERESWRLAFGLLVTLVWLYLEIIRLLAILNRR